MSAYDITYFNVSGGGISLRSIRSVVTKASPLSSLVSVRSVLFSEPIRRRNFRVLAAKNDC